MSATELAALIVAIAGVVAVVVVAIALVFITKTLKEVRTAVELLRTETVRGATAELERGDGLIDQAESISGTVDSASRLAYLPFSDPMIKVIALATGTSRAARSFRRQRTQ